jgi:uncharacterized protein YegP (UPF0339 family)
MKSRFELYPTAQVGAPGAREKRWGWRRRAANTRVLVQGELYHRAVDAEQAMLRVAEPVPLIDHSERYSCPCWTLRRTPTGWRVRRYATNGRILASGEGWKRRVDAVRTVQAIMAEPVEVVTLGARGRTRPGTRRTLVSGRAAVRVDA